MSLALATLIYEWRRYLAAVIALAFSGLLVLAQVGMFAGISKAFTAQIDRSPADLMVLGPKAESLFTGGAGMPARIKPRIYMSPEVVAVGEMPGNGGMFQNDPPPGKKRQRDYVQVFAIDPYPGSITLPTDYTEKNRVALLEPYAIAVDRTSLSKLGVKLGDKATLNGKTVKIGTILEGYPNVAQSTVYVSQDTYRLLGLQGRADRTGPLMVKIRNPAHAQQVRDQLNSQADGAYRVWTRGELAKANQGAMMKENMIGIMLGFALFLGLLIGLGITSQTLRGAILANIKEFASLRALGVSMGSLRLIVVELSFWVGVAGLVATAILTGVVSVLARAGGLPMAFPTTFIVLTAVFLIGIALVSGLLSLGVLKKSQPADLLR